MEQPSDTSSSNEKSMSLTKLRTLGVSSTSCDTLTRSVSMPQVSKTARLQAERNSAEEYVSD